MYFLIIIFFSKKLIQTVDVFFTLINNYISVKWKKSGKIFSEQRITLIGFKMFE